MSIQQSYKINAAAKQHARLEGAMQIFNEAVKQIDVRAINLDWFTAKSRDTTSFGSTPAIARAKCEQALRHELLSGLRVVV